MWLQKKGIRLSGQRKRTASSRGPPNIDEEEQGKRKQLTVLKADDDTTEEERAEGKPSDVSPSLAVSSVDEMNVTPPVENGITLLGKCYEDIVGLLHRYDHPGARSLHKGQKLTIEAEPENEHDALAVRVFDMEKKSCGFLPEESEIKHALATMLLNPIEHSWLDRIEVKYIRRQNMYAGRVSVRFFGSVNNLGRLQEAMGGWLE